MEHSLAPPNRERSGLAALVHPLVERRTYLETVDLLLDLGSGVLWFTVFTTMIATGLGTLILLIGPPILAATCLLARAGGWFERRRARLLLGTRIADPVRPPAKGDGVLQKLVTPMAAPDGSTGQTPLEVIMDIVADINRADPRATDKLRAGDYASIADNVSDFLGNKERGMEQFYEIVRQGTVR